MASAGQLTMNLEVDLRAMDLKPGDRIWIEIPKTLSQQQIDMIRQSIEDWLPAEVTKPVLLLDSGMKLRILSQEKADDVSTSNS
jgi:hypothetical protein